MLQFAALALNAGNEIVRTHEMIVERILDLVEFKFLLGQALTHFLIAGHVGIEKMVAQRADANACKAAGQRQDPIDIALVHVVPLKILSTRHWSFSAGVARCRGRDWRLPRAHYMGESETQVNAQVAAIMAALCARRLDTYNIRFRSPPSEVAKTLMCATTTSAGTSASAQAGTPLTRYQADLEREGFAYDEAQEQAVRHLQRLYDDLLATPQRAPRPPAGERKGLKSRVAGLFGAKQAASPFEAPPAVMGLYFWGGVGRGKTYLVDTFYEALPFLREDAHAFSSLHAARAQ